MPEALETPPRQAHFTTAEVAELCDVSTVMVGDWIRLGRLKAHRPPRGHCQVARQDFLDFLAANGMRIPLPLKRRAALRVLVADDEPMVRAVVANILETGGDMDVAVAADGFEASQLVAEFDPDVAVLDLCMPGIDGAATAKRIRNDPRTAHTRILFLTGHEDAESLALIKACGADGYISKPFVAKDLIEAVRGIAGQPAPVTP